jgi:hypothetical protein
MTRIQSSPDALEKGIAFFKEKVAPKASATPGNAGAVLLIDRKAGVAIGVTLWETTEALNASEQFGITSRTQSAAEIGGSVVDIDRFEQVIVDRAQSPKAGAFVRLNTVAGSPDKLDAVIAYMQKQLPVFRAQKGYRSLIMNVNRVTGRGTVSTGWDTMADLEASEAKASGLRREGAATAGAKSDVRVEIFELAFVEIKQPTRV